MNGMGFNIGARSQPLPPHAMQAAGRRRLSMPLSVAIWLALGALGWAALSAPVLIWAAAEHLL